VPTNGPPANNRFLQQRPTDGQAFDPGALFAPAQSDVINTLQHLMKGLTRLQLAAQKDAMAAAMQVGATDYASCVFGWVVGALRNSRE
jgi:hypothetical protein